VTSKARAGIEHLQARRGAYADSVTLMQVSKVVAAVGGVTAALVAMATELNVDLARGMGFEVAPDTSANDLLVAIRAIDEMSLLTAVEAADAALAPSRPATGGGPAPVQPPRTTASALRRTSAGLVLVSVPGRAAFAEAMDALEAGADVMIFSDNVPVAHELALKRRAGELGRLVMGPDCGTAVVGGLGLGFANAVPAGPVGIVAASGTGAQQLLCLLAIAGVGVSGCLGVGGRDLSAAVGARSTMTALELFDADPGTELIVVVSKPPAAEVAAAVRARADQLGTPVQFGLLGAGQPDLTVLAEAVVVATGNPVPEWPQWLPEAGPAASSAGSASDSSAGSSAGSAAGSSARSRDGRRGGGLRGLYSGGTLCDEAMLIASAVLGEIRSNIALRPEWALPADLRHPSSGGHLMIDFGDDLLTQGRPHPMIDATLRSERLAAETADPSASVVLLDVVLGYGADLDPAALLAPAISAATGAGLPVVVAMIGTDRDPQGLVAQATRLRDAGAAVFASNAAATRYALGLL
jgi:FdrA protein